MTKRYEKIKVMAIVMVLAMLMVSIIPITEGTDAASGDGDTYTYTLTYDSSAMSSGSAAISVSGMDAIYHPSYSGGTTSGYGDWTWNASTGLGPFNSFYAAFDMTDGNSFFAILNPYDLTKTISGDSLATIGNYNIMWVLPTVYWSSTSTSLTLTNDSTAGGVAYAHTINGHTYNYIAIGVYEGSTTTVDGSTVLTSASGTTPTASQTLATFRGYAHNYTMSESLATDSSNPAYSMLWNFYQWQLYKYCCWTLMENFNSQNVVGNGPVFSTVTSGNTYGHTSNYAWTTGYTNALGPYSGDPTSITDNTTLASYGEQPAKLFLENAWGGVREFVDGININAKAGAYIDTSDTPAHGTSGTYVSAVTWTIADGYPTSIQTDNAQVWGFSGSTTTTATTGATTGLTDYTYTSTSTNRVLNVGGAADTDWSAAVQYGLSFANADRVTSYSSANLGSRLAFVFDAGPASEATVTIQSNNANYGAVDVSTLTVPIGSTITASGSTLNIDGTPVTATPTSSTVQYTYAFSNWSGIPSSGTIDGDTTIMANFTRTLNNYTVSIAVSPSGYGTVSQNSITVPYGTAISSSGTTLTIGSNSITASPSAADAQYTYAFGSWTIPTATVQGAMTVTANFTATTNEYTVSIVPNDATYGSVSASSVTVPYGTAISSSGSSLTIGSNTITATPATATAEYTYSFGSWTNGSGTVTGTMTVTANFIATTNQYTVTTAASPTGYGTVSSNSVTVDYGTAISSSGSTLTIGSNTITATPTVADAQYTYAFDSWTNATGTVTGNRTITANFSQSVNDYTVTIQTDGSGYGTVSQNSITVPYGTAMSVNGNELTIGATTIQATSNADTDEYDFRFVDWTGTTATVTDNMTVQANFEAIKRNYQITIEVDPSGYGTVSRNIVTSVPYGTAISASGNVLTISTATAVTVTATPTAADAQYTYSFGSWTGIPSGGSIVGDVTITANFTRSVNSYTVTIAADPSGYGSVSPTTITDVPYGTTIDVSDNVLTVRTSPSTTVTATAAADTTEWDYRFSSWSVSDEYEITGNLSITANFVREKQTYTVTINSNDLDYGTIVPVGSIENVPYGSVISIDGIDMTINGTTVTATVASATVQYVYTFDGYSVQDGDTVTGNLTITATFSSSIRTYIVMITPNDATYGSVTVSEIPDVPYDSVIHVSGDTVTVNSVSSQAQPAAATAQYTYAFSGWSVSDGDHVVGETTITASFTRTVNTYAVTIQADSSGYGSVAPTTVSNVPYGARITLNGNVLTVNDTEVTATPNPNTAEWKYSFNGWSVENDHEVTGNVTVTASFARAASLYDLTITVNNSSYGEVDEVSITDVPYGTALSVSGNVLTVSTSPAQTVTATPKAQTEQYTFAFSDWSGVTATVTGDLTITANFTPTLRNYTVTIVPNDPSYGTVSQGSVLNVPYGTTITADDDVLDVNGTEVTATAAASTAQYTFAFSDWSIGESAHLTGDMTITAMFTPTLRSYTVTIAVSPNGYGYVSHSQIQNVPYGTAITTSGNIINVNGTTVTPIPADADNHWTYYFDQWTDIPSQIVGDTTVTAVFDRELTTHTITIVPNNANYGTVSPTTVTGVPYGTVISESSNTLDVNGTTVTATPSDADAQYTYSFGLWSIPQITVQGSMTITANFEVAVNYYTITWMYDEETVLDTTSVAYGEMPSHDAPERYGYVFGGWVPSLTIVTETATYTPNWIEMVKYIVTFDAETNGGSTDTSTKEVYNGLTYGDLPKATKANYDFLGWFTEPSGGTKITSDTQVDLDSNITLYAQFEPSESATIVNTIPYIAVIGIIMGIGGAIYTGRDKMEFDTMIHLILGGAIGVLAVVFILIPLIG